MSRTDRPAPRARNSASRSGDRLAWTELFRLRSANDAERWLRTNLGGSARPDRLDEAELRSALAAWDAARGEIDRKEIGLRSRVIEIGLIQALSQRAAEASGVLDLFARAADVLGTAGPMHVALAVHRLAGRTCAEAFASVPVDPEALHTLGRRAERFLEWDPVDRLVLSTRRTGGFDASHGMLRSIREQDTTFLPIRRRSTTVACLALVHASPPDAALSRVLFSAANQISLQLDRILAVREAEQDRFRSILDSMSPAVVVTDLALRVRHANRTARPLLRRLGVDTDGGPLVPATGLDLEPLVRRVIEGEVDGVQDELISDAVGAVHVNVSSVRSPEGTPDGLVIVLTDVTDARRMQQQLAQAEKMSSLGEMISGVAHELNNPLASILGYAQLLHATCADDSIRPKLEILDGESRRCQKIVQNLLTFARRHEPERRAFSINEIVESVASLLRYQLKVDGIAIVRRLDSQVPAIYGDPHLVQQAFINLLTNAHHAMRDARLEGEVRIFTEPVGLENVRCVVEDDGPGIPPAIASRVFDPFFTTKASGKGTGLGLALVYSNVVAQGGTVTLERAERGGARFVIELPVGSDEDRRDPEQANAATERPPPSRILVVEDEEPIADLVEEALSAEGHAVTIAADGAAALDRLERERFDAVVIDWRVPVLGGERLIERIRQVRPETLERVVLMTGDTVSREPDEIAARDRVPVLHKPFDLGELRRVVHERLGRERGS